jgi:FKBP-type peptidyl-prolyl cis-trans isomerase 2
MDSHIKEGDFVELDFTGMVKEDNFIFDTSSEKIAKESDLFEQGRKYGPVVACIGEGHMLPGLEKKLVGKEIGKEYTIELTPEEGFGTKSAKLIQLISTAKFRKDNIDPVPGMQVNVDGNIGIIKTVTGGRTMVDFNNPLASKELVYKVKTIRMITDDLEKADNSMKMLLGDNHKSELKDGNLEVTLKSKLPAEIEKLIEEKVIKMVPSIKKVTFIAENKGKDAKAAKKADASDAEEDAGTDSEGIA